MSEELIIGLITIILSAFGSVIWKWVSNVENKLNNIEENVNPITPVINEHIKRLHVIEEKMDQLITNETNTSEKMVHLIQIMNKEFYKLKALSTEFQECKKAHNLKNKSRATVGNNNFGANPS